MDSHHSDLKKNQEEWHGSLRAYLIGFTLSLALTAISFLLVITRLIPAQLLIGIITCLAIVQAMVQLLFFFHLGQKAKFCLELLLFYFMLLVLFIIAAGSLWIMLDLNHRTMSGMTMEMPHD